MVIIQGKGVSGGIAIGPLYRFRRSAAAFSKARSGDLAEERERLAAARASSAARLEELAGRCVDPEAAVLFQTHAMMVEDEDFCACAAALLEEGCSAEYAVQCAGERFAALFSAMDDPYMRERAEDIRDVARRIVDELLGTTPGGDGPALPCVIYAGDLSPSELVQLPRERVLGLALRQGGATSHTAILARTMGIPTVCALEGELPGGLEGRLCCLDGETGRVVLEPDREMLSAMAEKLGTQVEERRCLEELRGREDVTQDGRRLSICCNIGRPEEAAEVLRQDGRGIGLFRSEFLYLGSEQLPDEETQFQAYRAVAQTMAGKRVVIRTLDVGADKQAPCLDLEGEENPALGMRGVRVSLARPELFKTQLRAIYRASAYGKVAVMFPMITAVWEVRACKALCCQVIDELAREGMPHDRDVEIGVMIETPAAVLLAEELAREVDFFSVGTNDLTQYILACDRQHAGLGRTADPRHPAVLRSLKMAADAAHAAGIRIGICGELAGEVDLLGDFLDMGIDELSVAPGRVLPVRKALRRLCKE